MAFHSCQTSCSIFFLESMYTIQLKDNCRKLQNIRSESYKDICPVPRLGVLVNPDLLEDLPRMIHRHKVGQQLYLLHQLFN